MRSLRILLLGSAELDRSRVRALLETQEGWSVVCCAEDSGALDRAKAFQPDIVIAKACTEDSEFSFESRGLSQLTSIARFLIFCGDESEDHIWRALRAGAQGYILTGEFDRKIVKAVKEVAQGRRFLSAQVTKVILRRFLAPPSQAGRSAGTVPLTPREIEIVRLLSSGNGNKQVAADLGIAVRTAETHRANIMKKLRLHSVAELIHFAISWDIVKTGSSVDSSSLTLSQER